MSDTNLSRLYLFHETTQSIPLPNGQALKLCSGCYLVQASDGRNILIDSGMPVGQPQEGPSASGPRKTVFEHLTSLSLRPGDIQIVICTHFDIDHAGNLDAFASAELVVQRAHYEVARAGHERYAAARAHWDHPALRYRLIEGDLELLPGLRLIETSGHAPGHQSVLLTLPETGPVLLTGDAVPIRRLFTPERKPWPDDDDEQALLASTRKLMALVEQEQVQLTIFHHDGEEWDILSRAPAFYA